MTVVLKNQFVFRFAIGPYEDFIQTEDLTDFAYIKSAGNVLPVVKISFIIRDLAITDYFNEGNILNISVGRTQLQLIDSQFRLIDSGITRYDRTLGSKVTLSGVLHIPKYNMIEKVRAFKDMTSLEVMKAVASDHFIFSTNLTKTNDRQSWRQTGQTDRHFLRDVWLHSYLTENTFMAMAFDDRKLIFKDMRTALLNETPWKFTTVASSAEESKLVNFNNYWVHDDYGVSNSIIGRNKDIKQLNFDNSDLNQISSNLKNFTTLGSDKLNILNDNVNEYNYTYINSNVHENYNIAYAQNVRNLIMFSNTKIYITFAGQFKQFDLLDVAKVELNIEDRRVVGNSFITRVVYQILDRKLVTNVVLCREAPNELKGEHLA